MNDRDNIYIDNTGGTEERYGREHVAPEVKVQVWQEEDECFPPTPEQARLLVFLVLLGLLVSGLVYSWAFTLWR